MKYILKPRALIALCLVSALVCSETYAYGGDHGGGHRGGGSGGGIDPRGRGAWHHYRDGQWYRNGWFWFDTAVTALVVGAFIDRLPSRYTVVVYQGVPYYYAEGYYYRPYERGGYIVVQLPIVTQPVVITQQVPAVTTIEPVSQPQESDAVIINIPNSKGTYTPVTLKKAGTGYIGPQGEYYSEHPTVAQLKILYGGN